MAPHTLQYRTLQDIIKIIVSEGDVKMVRETQSAPGGRTGGEILTVSFNICQK